MPASLVWYWAVIIGCSQVSDERNLQMLQLTLYSCRKCAELAA